MQLGRANARRDLKPSIGGKISAGPKIYPQLGYCGHQTGHKPLGRRVITRVGEYVHPHDKVERHGTRGSLKLGCGFPSGLTALRVWNVRWDQKLAVDLAKLLPAGQTESHFGTTSPEIVSQSCEPQEGCHFGSTSFLLEKGLLKNPFEKFLLEKTP